jgi:hypothetical protein
LVAELDKPNLPQDKERRIRLRLWWLANNDDAIRYREEDETRPNFTAPPGFRSNLLCLLELMHGDECDEQSRLRKAEIYRELGDFVKSLQLPEDPFADNFQNRDAVVKEINPKHTKGIQRPDSMK